MLNQLQSQGYALTPPLLDMAACDDLIERVMALGDVSAGTRRLLDHGWCAALARRLLAAPLLQTALPTNAICIQCTYFEKSPTRNWLVAWHQDLSVPVAARTDHPASAGWSEKEGQVFVQPPAALLEQLVALRLQLDDSGGDAGPLKVVPGSHRAGRLSDAAIADWREQHGEVVCIVPRGAGLLLRPLLLHASAKATSGRPRRVLHFLFAPAQAGYGLQWNAPVRRAAIC